MEFYDKLLNIIDIEINEQRLERENVEPKVVDKNNAS